MADCKTGAEHLKSLQGGRTVYLDGELVAEFAAGYKQRPIGPMIGKPRGLVANPVPIQQSGDRLAVLGRGHGRRGNM